MKHYPPKHNESKFHCPNCGVYSIQYWATCVFWLSNTHFTTEISVSVCGHCDKNAYWYNDNLLIPSSGTVELPSPDMPDDCKTVFLEARDIVNKSPRGSSALLRLCIQKLMKHLGKSGNNINSDISSLVKEGLPVLIQQSLDICRVVGNNAVHPGEIDLNDTPEIAHSLFQLINIIVQDRISRPKEIESLYSSLPTGAREAIEKRDKA